MANPKFYYISDVDPVIVLNPGHGGSDPGAVHNGVKESDQVVRIVDTIYNLLKPKYDKVVKVPTHLGLVDGINWMNQRYTKLDSAVAFSIHRDSAAGLDYNDASNRMGVYGFGHFTMNGKFYSEDTNSMNIARNITAIMKREGANNKSWTRPDHVARFGRLGEIRDPKCLSYIIEAAFMQGDKSDAHLDELSRRITIAIYETITGKSWNSNTASPVVVTPSKPVSNQPVNLSGWEATANAAQKNTGLWNNKHINDVIKNAVTGTRDVSYLLQEIIWRSDARDGFQNRVKQLETKLSDLTRIKENIDKAYNNQYEATNLYIKKYNEGLAEIKKLEGQLESVNNQPSTKSFWSSKKVRVFLLTYGAELGMAITYLLSTAGVDSPETIVMNTLAFVGSVFGLSYAGGKYIEKQGEIDKIKQATVKDTNILDVVDTTKTNM